MGWGGSSGVALSHQPGQLCWSAITGVVGLGWASSCVVWCWVACGGTTNHITAPITAPITTTLLHGGGEGVAIKVCHLPLFWARDEEELDGEGRER